MIAGVPRAAGRVIQFVFRMDNKIKAIMSYAPVTLLKVDGWRSRSPDPGKDVVVGMQQSANFSLIIFISAAQLIEEGDRREMQGLRG